MDNISCPFCGSQIDIGAKTCPSCGKSLDDVDENENSGINNSDAIEAMLRSAAQLMQDSEEYTFDDEQEGDDNDDSVSGKRAENTELTSEQKEALDKGSVVSLTSDSSSNTEESLGTVSLSDDEPDENINEPEAETVDPAKNDAEDVEEPEEEIKASDEHIIEEPEEPKTEATPVTESPKEINKKEKRKRSSIKRKRLKLPIHVLKVSEKKHFPILLSAAMFAMLLLGFLAGFVVNSRFFSELTPTGDEYDAQLCAAAVCAGKAENEDFFVVSVYLRRGVNDNTCVILGGMRNGTESTKLDWYRVRYDKDTDEYNVYLPLDEAYYKSLAEGTDAQGKVLAAVLKNYADVTASCVSDISSGKSEWTEIDMSVINRYLINIDEDDIRYTTEDSSELTDLS